MMADPRAEGCRDGEVLGAVEVEREVGERLGDRAIGLGHDAATEVLRGVINSKGRVEARSRGLGGRDWAVLGGAGLRASVWAHFEFFERDRGKRRGVLRAGGSGNDGKGEKCGSMSENR